MRIELVILKASAEDRAAVYLEWCNRQDKFIARCYRNRPKFRTRGAGATSRAERKAALRIWTRARILQAACRRETRRIATLDGAKVVRHSKRVDIYDRWHKALARLSLGAAAAARGLSEIAMAAKELNDAN